MTPLQSLYPKNWLFIMLMAHALSAASQTPDLNINWNEAVSVSVSMPSYQVVVNPMLKRNSPIHDSIFSAIKNMSAGMVRFATWFPYPKLAVAELDPPTADKTSWDFSFIDAIVNDFMEANGDNDALLNFSTIPQWLFKTEKPEPYPVSEDSVTWTYNRGTELRDTTLKELGDYFARIVSWYTQGGLTDEHGRFHASGHHYKIPYWEVLNETELEHSTSIEKYTRYYDAIVNAIKKVSPQTKFIGMASVVYGNPGAFEYFLNPRNHKPGTPLDFISYHFYAGTNSLQPWSDYQYTYFDKCDAFINCVKYIENIRKRSAPQVKTYINELGTFLTDAMRNEVKIPGEYWNLSAAVYAYLFLELTKLQIDAIGESQLVGYPTQFPDVSMINWENGKPNARYWALKLIKENFNPGDTLVQTNFWFQGQGVDYEAQGFKGRSGRKILLLNKRDKTLNIKIPSYLQGATIISVDGSSGENEPLPGKIEGTVLQLKPFAVAVIQLP